jgi:hypothetical protein
MSTTSTDRAAASSAPPASASAWTPLRNPPFRNLWIATIVSNVGTWMQDVGAGWLMTSLSSSPQLVALVEAADSFAIMLLALPAGALADIIDRRRLLIGVQAYLMVVAGLLGVLTLLGATTPWLLLGFTFALGIGAAMTMPAWSAIVPELVPAEQLTAAVALNSVAVNISRAVGPSIAGVLVAAVGPWLVFILNALSYIGVIAVLLQWKREHRKSTLPAERFLTAIRMALRFVLHTRPLQIVLLRGIAFFAFASATWSLFPLIVRQELQRGPEVYGCGWRDVATQGARGAVARRSRRWCERHLRRGGARARLCREHRSACYRHARNRRRMDIDPVGVTGFRPDGPTGMGARVALRRSSSCSWAAWRWAASCGVRSPLTSESPPR